MMECTRRGGGISFFVEFGFRLHIHFCSVLQLVFVTITSLASVLCDVVRRTKARKISLLALLGSKRQRENATWLSSSSSLLSLSFIRHVNTRY